MPLSPSLRDDRGSVAILFGLALVPMVGLAGMAMDYARSSAVRAELQSALDATALSIAKEIPTLEGDALQAKAQQFFEANFPSYQDYPFDPVVVESAGGTVRVSAEGKIPTTVLAALNIPAFDVGASSQVGWSSRRLEVALVLDNTGSMSWAGKMDELKSATRGMFAEMLDMAPGAIRIAIVPFGTQVNIGADHIEADWLLFSHPRDSVESFFGAEELLALEHQLSGRAPDEVVAEADRIDLDEIRAGWQGCVADRLEPVDVSDEPVIDADLSTHYLPAVCDKALAPVQPLTVLDAANSGELEAAVDAMQPSGNTNITIGIAWGLAALTPQAPLTEAAAEDDEVDRIMVVLTDGENTENRWTENADEIDARTREACSSVKAAGISLHTVRVIEGDEALLSACASEPEMYHSIENASQLGALFKNLAQQFLSLRLTQ